MAGLALAVGIEGLVVFRDPRETLDSFIATGIIFGIVWTIAFALGGKFQEADEAKERAAAPSVSARNEHGPQSARSARGSRESSMTSSATASAS